MSEPHVRREDVNEYRWRAATDADYDDEGCPARLEDPDGTHIQFWEYYVDENGYG